MSCSYGVYDDDVVVDYEEVVRSSRDFSEDEMLFVRSINFFIVAFWNLGMAKPLLKWLHQEEGINPLDAILTFAKGGVNQVLDDFLKEFRSEALNEWFDTEEELVEYYTKNFKSLSENGFLKMDLKYTAKLLLNRRLTKSMLDAMASQCKSDLTKQLTQFCMDSIYFMDFREKFKECTYSDSLVEGLKKIYPLSPIDGNKCRFKLEDGSEEAIDFEFKKYRFDEEPTQALAQTLEGPYVRKFLLEFKFSKEAKTVEAI